LQDTSFFPPEENTFSDYDGTGFPNFSGEAVAMCMMFVELCFGCLLVRAITCDSKMRQAVEV
jgi:hypothetical protein